MKVKTRYFGEIEIGDEKIIHFDEGLFGFEEYKDFTILYDVEGDEDPFFSWLQCTTEQGLAFPVVNPQKVDPGYNPLVEDALLESIGEIKEDDLVVLLMATVPSDVKKTSVNKKAPLIINAGTHKGIQIVAENQDYEVKFYLIQED
ncbi:MAG: flagellar assembly protein FliW [Lachnospiraceae bacterium]|nr:flagellar assembly protein FliW [Lachnospiraceae bacterium]